MSFCREIRKWCFGRREGTYTHCELVVGEERWHEIKKVLIILVELDGEDGELR
jgi:hypothetical protein